MKLVVKPVLRQGRLMLALCSEDGTCLPGQKDVFLSQPFRDAAEVTVTFLIDGKKVALAPHDGGAEA